LKKQKRTFFVAVITDMGSVCGTVLLNFFNRHYF
jgi:hypothetical protein